MENVENKMVFSKIFWKY